MIDGTEALLFRSCAMGMWYTLSFGLHFGLGSSQLDDFQKFVELNEATLIVINGLDNVLNLLPVVNKTKGNQWFFKLIDSDTTGIIVVQLTEALS